MAALKDLPEEYRVPLVLYYREGQSTRAVAKVLELSEAAVSKRLSRGRVMLRAKLEKAVEDVLGKALPGAAFTATVAGLIGLGTTRSAVAATTYSISKKGAAAAATSKLSVKAAALVTVAAIPLGYTSHLALDSPRVSLPLRSQAAFDQRLENRLLAESEIVKEWRTLLAGYGASPERFPEMWEIIEGIDSDVRRQAFQHLLAVEWAQRDMNGGMLFYTQDGKPWAQRDSFENECLKLGVHDFIDALVALPPDLEYRMNYHIAGMIANAPERFDEIIEQFPRELLQRTNVLTGLSSLAESKPEFAMKLVDRLPESLQKRAAREVVSGWSKTAGLEALNWVMERGSEIEREELIQLVLKNWAEDAPTEVLDRLVTLPLGGSPFDDSVGCGRAVRLSRSVEMVSRSPRA